MMRFGFTTGSCAAAAAKAATYMLLTGKLKERISITTPKGMVFHAQLLEIVRTETSVSCAVIKDGGDDPDITTGIKVFAKVIAEEIPCIAQESRNSEGNLARISIDGGIGVGRVTKPGLDQPIGNAAINRVPRNMIEKEVREVCEFADYQGNLSIIISIPEGESLSKKTFNPRLGIVGGISVLGTSGVVEPMSSQALVDTIQVELNVKKAEGCEVLAISPGNYGIDFMKSQYKLNLDESVKCSNFIGKTIDMAIETGFTKMLLMGHIGKLIKVSGGIMNTHSNQGDCRMELLVAAAVKANVSSDMLPSILDCVSTTEAIAYLVEDGKCQEVMQIVLQKILFYLNKRAEDKLQIECVLYDNQYGELARSEDAIHFINRIRKDAEEK